MAALRERQCEAGCRCDGGRCADGLLRFKVWPEGAPSGALIALAGNLGFSCPQCATPGNIHDFDTVREGLSRLRRKFFEQGGQECPRSCGPRQGVEARVSAVECGSPAAAVGHGSLLPGWSLVAAWRSFLSMPCAAPGCRSRLRAHSG